MHRRFSIKNLLVLLLCLTASASGCHHKRIEASDFTLGDWMILLCEKAGIQQYEQQDPWFANVTPSMACFEAVQAAAEWDILKTDIPFPYDQPTDRQWVAYTLAGLLGRKEGMKCKADDTVDCFAAVEIGQVMEVGLMTTKDGRFMPQEKISREDAEIILDRALQIINHRRFENVSEFRLHDAVMQEKPLSFDQESMEALYDADCGIEAGMITAFEDDEGNLHICRVLSVDSSETGNRVLLEECEELEEAGDFDYQGSMDADFSNAEIQIGKETVQESSAVNEVQLLAVQSLQKTFSLSGYSIVLKVTPTSITAEANRTMPDGVKVYADLKINRVRCSYQFKTADADNSYFCVSFSTEEDAGFRKAVSETRQADFTNVNRESFVSMMESLWKKSVQAEDTVLTICTINLPIPQQPALSLQMSLDLHMHASGKCELTLVQKHVLGAETRNGKVRIIRNTDSTGTASIKASAGVTAGMDFALCLLKKRVADLNVEAGVRASASTTLHLLDENGRQEVRATSADEDFAAQLCADRKDIQVCSDVRAYWVLDCDLNGSDSILGRLGMGTSFSILNERNAPVFATLNSHFENGIRVKRCTRTGRRPLPEAEELKIAEGLMISEYLMVVNEGGTGRTEVTSLPAGVKEKDLVYEIADPAVAYVDSDGTVHGRSSGSTVLMISTPDGAYTANCTVLCVKVT